MTTEIYPPCWVTRNRHPAVQQLPHPDAMDEWLDGKPTGRIKKIAPGGSVLIGTVEEVDDWLSQMPTQALLDGLALHNKLAAEAAEKRKAAETAAEEARRASIIRHSGLQRNRFEEERLRGMIEKFTGGSEVSDLELRFLLQYYGIMIRMCEMSGQRYYLAWIDACNQRQCLLSIAAERGWTQNLINMYGGMIEGVFTRIC